MIVISRLVISSEIVHSNQAPQCPSKRLGQSESEETKSDIVETAHTHLGLGHTEELKKKGLVLVAHVMTHEEFELLVADRNESIVDSLLNSLIRHLPMS